MGYVHDVVYWKWGYCALTVWLTQNTEYYLTSACVSPRLTNLQAYPTHRSHNPRNVLERSRYPILPNTEFDFSPWDRDLALSTAVDHHWSGNYMSSQAAPHYIVAFRGEINSEFNIAWEQVTILAVYCHERGQKCEFRSNSYSMQLFTARRSVSI